MLTVVQLCKTSEELRNAEREVERLRTALERNEKQSVDCLTTDSSLLAVFSKVIEFQQHFCLNLK